MVRGPQGRDEFELLGELDTFEDWGLYGTDGKLITLMQRVHPRHACQGPCTYHSPSPGRMRRWPLHVQLNPLIISRVCAHGKLCVDPDWLQHYLRTTPSGLAGLGLTDRWCPRCAEPRRFLRYVPPRRRSA